MWPGWTRFELGMKTGRRQTKGDPLTQLFLQDFRQGIPLKQSSLPFPSDFYNRY